jgi:tetratricopeptide (TPR) repeat protein
MQIVTRHYGSPASRRLARETLERLEPFLKASDRDAELLVLAAASAYSIGDLKRAEQLYAEAAALEGRPEIMTYLGAVQSEMALPDKAIASFGRAVAFAPSFINRDEIGPLRAEVDSRANAIRAGRD